MTLPRRRFLQSVSGLAMGVAAPGVWGRLATAAPEAGALGGRETILVVVQLGGGNDGLNTVAPVRDPAYIAARPTLRVRPEQSLALAGGFAFHPKLKGMAELLERSQLAVVQGVGYPNPDRSHFVSMDIWHRGSFAEEDTTGWLGKACDRFSSGVGALHVGPGETPLAVENRSGKSMSLQSIDDYRLKVSEFGDDPVRRLAIRGFAARNDRELSVGPNPLLDKIRQTALETHASTERVDRAVRESGASIGFPATELGTRLQLISRLIAGGIPERVFFTAQDGYDTHASQGTAHGNLLADLGDSLAAFQKELERHEVADRVLTLVFSEFGRRVRENSSGGTDHGAASCMFLSGTAVKAGLHGVFPGFDQLDDGDLRHTVDFRSVYATVLDQWLGVPSAGILGPGFAPLGVLRG
jgi:uncharacterized protein (DUF1501 family)